LVHLLDRVIAREITLANLYQMQRWIKTNPPYPKAIGINGSERFRYVAKARL